MVKPFIRNHQYNLIKKQVELLQHACSTVTDPSVVQSVRYSAQASIFEAFPAAEEYQIQALEKIASLNTTEQFQHYLLSLEPYLTEFPRVTGKQISKLFPKVKKLKLPDLESIDFRYITYLGWGDIASNKWFLVYELDGEIVGIDGTYTPSSKGVCCLCNRHEDVALLSAFSQSRPANASPDYYKAIGNYMCVDSEICNKNITDTSALEKFIREVKGKR